jgi:hypothetical protein
MVLISSIISSSSNAAESKIGLGNDFAYEKFPDPAKLTAIDII